MEIVSSSKCWGGWQRTYRHESETCAAPMQFAAYLPPAAEHGPVPAVYWLSGLTCSEENFSTKAGAQRYAAELGLALIVPDTSPRDLGAAFETGKMNVGTAAGFYVDATQPPWNEHYNMYSYVAEELVAVVNDGLPLDPARKSLTGHSMGGHGALTIGLKHPDRYAFVSAFSPIASAPRSGWGAEALEAYLGPDRQAWHEYDASWLVANQPCEHGLVIDQGADDPALDQLNPQLLTEAAARSGQRLEMNLRSGYDHGYYFVSSFIGRHLKLHADALGAL